MTDNKEKWFLRYGGDRIEEITYKEYKNYFYQGKLNDSLDENRELPQLLQFSYCDYADNETRYTCMFNIGKHARKSRCCFRHRI